MPGRDKVASMKAGWGQWENQVGPTLSEEGWLVLDFNYVCVWKSSFTRSSMFSREVWIPENAIAKQNTSEDFSLRRYEWNHQITACNLWNKCSFIRAIPWAPILGFCSVKNGMFLDVKMKIKGEWWSGLSKMVKAFFSCILCFCSMFDWFNPPNSSPKLPDARPLQCYSRLLLISSSTLVFILSPLQPLPTPFQNPSLFFIPGLYLHPPAFCLCCLWFRALGYHQPWYLKASEILREKLNVFLWWDI